MPVYDSPWSRFPKRLLQPRTKRTLANLNLDVPPANALRRLDPVECPARHHVTLLINHVGPETLDSYARRVLAHQSIQFADAEEIRQEAYQDLLKRFDAEQYNRDTKRGRRALLAYWRRTLRTKLVDHYRHWNRRGEVELRVFHVGREDDAARAGENREMQRAITKAGQLEAAKRLVLIILWIHTMSARDQNGRENLNYGSLTASVDRYNKLCRSNQLQTISIPTGFRWIETFRDRCRRLLR